MSESMEKELLGAVGTLTLKCQDLERHIRDLETGQKKLKRENRRLSFGMQLELACIIFLCLGMGILARG